VPVSYIFELIKINLTPFSDILIGAGTSFQPLVVFFSDKVGILSHRQGYHIPHDEPGHRRSKGFKRADFRYLVLFLETGEFRLSCSLIPVTCRHHLNHDVACCQDDGYDYDGGSFQSP